MTCANSVRACSSRFEEDTGDRVRYCEQRGVVGRGRVPQRHREQRPYRLGADLVIGRRRDRHGWPVASEPKDVREIASHSSDALSPGKMNAAPTSSRPAGWVRSRPKVTMATLPMDLKMTTESGGIVDQRRTA